MIKQYFVDNCISVRAWAKKYGLDMDTTYKVLNGSLTGERNTKGNTRAVFKALLNEGIINELPSGLKEVKVDE